MVRSFVAVAAALLGATSVVPTESHAFANLPIGASIRNRELPTLDGKRAPLFTKAKANVFVFFRPGQDHSLQVLGQLARLERELEGKPVRFVAVTSDGYARDEVAAAIRESGVRMPVLLDAGDALYGELGVALHPVVGIADDQGRLTGYQHFLKINMQDVLRGRIQLALGEIGPAELAKLVDPPAAAVDLGARAAAKSRFLLARALLGRGNVEKALENARAGVALDPTYAPVHAILAKALAASGRCAEGEAERLSALKLDPADPTASAGQATCVASR